MNSTCIKFSVALIFASQLIEVGEAEANALKTPKNWILGCWEDGMWGDEKSVSGKGWSGETVCFHKNGKVEAASVSALEHEALGAVGRYKVFGRKIVFTTNEGSDGWLFVHPNVQCTFVESLYGQLVLSGCTDFIVGGRTFSRTPRGKAPGYTTHPNELLPLAPAAVFFH